MTAPLLRLREIARLEQCTRRMVLNYVRDGYKGQHKLPAVRHGNRWMVSVANWQAWRVACGFDPAPVPAYKAKPHSVVIPQVIAPPAPAPAAESAPRPYPPYPQAADPNGVLTNVPDPHSRNMPHPLACRDHSEAEARRMLRELRGYDSDN